MSFLDSLSRCLSSFFFAYIVALIYEYFIYVNVIPYLEGVIQIKDARNKLIAFPIIGVVFISFAINFGGPAWQILGGITSIGFLERVTGTEQKYKDIISVSKEEKVSNRRQSYKEEMKKKNGPQIEKIEEKVSSLELTEIDTDNTV